MVRLTGLIISILLIGIILLRIPEESLGLTSVADKSQVLGSPSSAQRFLNILTGFGILIYFGVAIQLNLSSR